MSVYDIRPSRASSARIRRSSFSITAIVPVSACGLAENYAFGHGVALLSGLLRRSRLNAHSGRDANQCLAGTVGLHQPAGHHLRSLSPRVLLGQRLAAAMAG